MCFQRLLAFCYVADARNFSQEELVMKFDSIKSRLVLMTLVCVIGMGVLVVSQHYFTQRLIGLHQQRDVLLRMGQDLLQMRRHEKDFLLRHETVYYDKFLERSYEFKGRLTTLVPLFNEYRLPVADVESLSSSIEAYSGTFRQVVSLQERIGLSQNDGLRARITELENTLSEGLRAQDSQASELLTGIQLATRNYQINQEGVYARQMMTLSERLASEYSGTALLSGTLVQYREALLQLVDAFTTYGVTHNEGLRGEFRQSAHNVETQLKGVDAALQPMIEQQEAQVRIYSLSIAALTSVVLILVLIKSFATFHRAFVNFLTFFYRCKRQYQTIDTRKLGFAELKSLAELANEMVESKRDIEARLASVEAELANKKAS